MSIRNVLFLLVPGLVAVWACDSTQEANPPTASCVTAMKQVNTACCPGGPDHGDPDSWESSVTYTDCLTHEQVTVPCTDGSNFPVDQTTESDAIDAGNPGTACQEAIDLAVVACPGYDPADESQAIECPDETTWDVLPSCGELQAFADAIENCSPLNLRGWEPIAEEDVEKLHDSWKTDPDDVAVDEPPPEENHDDGEPVPEVAIEAANKLLSSLRLEIPGNFLRYHLRHGPLRSGFEMASQIDGFNCFPDELRCQVNPLALFDLTDMFPNDGAFKVDVAKVDLGGQVGWRLQNIRFEPDLDGYAEMRVTWGGHVDVAMEDPIEINLGPPSTLHLLPLHMPDDEQGDNGTNSYPLTGIKFPDRQRNMLDQALIITHLDPTTCWNFKLDPAYLTYALPMRCNCPSSAGEYGYCITELSPRVEPHLEILTYATTTDHAFLAYCTDPLVMEPSPYKQHFQAALGPNDPDLSNGRATIPVDQFVANAATGGEFTVSPEQCTQDLIEFGCSGRLSAMARVGTQLVSDFGGVTLTAGKAAASAAGIQMTTTVGMGGLRLEVASGRVEFAFDVGARFDEWLKKKFGGVFGWFLKWVLKILAGWINLEIGFDLPPPGIPNAAHLDLDPMDIGIEGLISQVEPPDGSARQGFAVGVRRITTNKPHFDEDNWRLDVTWQAPNCDDAFSSNTTLLKRWEALVKCPMDIVYNLAGMAVQPLTTFLAKQMLDAVFDLSGLINAALIETVVSQVSAMEDGNILAQLIKDAGTNFLFAPTYMGTLGDPVKASVGELPPYLAAVCAAAPNPEMACTLMHLLAGNGFLSGAVTLDLLRVGAKTHYRSMDAFESQRPGYCFPPVRYCVVGDDPPGAPFFSAASRSTSQDFDEVDVAESGGLDWHHQCALFADFNARVRGSLTTPSGGYEIGIWLSERSQLLINEMFVCRNSAYCHPASDPNYLASRAELAACSLLGDIWGHALGSADPYVNELYLLTTVTEPDGLANLQAVWDTFRKAIGLEQSANTFDQLLTFAGECQIMLEDAGFPEPPETMPAEAFLEPLPYECEPEFIEY